MGLPIRGCSTPYGISVWTCILFERFVGCRPLHRVSAWLAEMGLPISPGTLADSVKRFVPLFEPLAEAILAHQNKAALRHADETAWERQANWRKVAGVSPAGRRSNQPLPPRVMGRHSRGCRLSVDRGAYGRGRLSYEKSENQGAEAFQYVEGNTASTAMVRGSGPCGVEEPNRTYVGFHAGTWEVSMSSRGRSGIAKERRNP